MTITSIDQLVSALANDSQTHTVVTKASVSAPFNGWCSRWARPGLPLAGATPTAAEILSKDTLGAFPITNASAGKKLYIARVYLMDRTGSCTQMICDRLAHMAGLSGTNTGVQTVDLDITGTTFNLAARRGASDYSNLMWGLEWYATTGSTARTATITFTDHTGLTGQTTTVSIPASVGSFRFIPFTPSAVGQFIRSVESFQLNGTTGSAGNIGVTVVRPIYSLVTGDATTGEILDWQRLGLKEVENDAALMILTRLGSTSAGELNGSIKLIEG